MIVTIYFDQQGAMDYPFDNPLYFESYKAFAKLAKEQEVDVYFSRGATTYHGNMSFASRYEFRNSEPVFINEPYRCDMIFLKGYDIHLSPSDRTLNNIAMENVCKNKLETYQVFSQYMAPTFELTAENYQSVIDRIHTEMMVIKPIFGTEGKGIHVMKKSAFTLDVLATTQRYFAQQFVDSSGGVPGIVAGLHDMRLILFNGTAKNSYIRQPKQGSYLANIAQGGSFLHVPIQKIPASALQMAKDIDSHFSQYTPRLYAIDLMYEQAIPYLVELNDQPGMPFMDEDTYNNSATQFHLDLLSLLTNK
jgi:hypothetical protein